jgi:hypothetical protein
VKAIGGLVAMGGVVCLHVANDKETGVKLLQAAALSKVPDLISKGIKLKDLAFLVKEVQHHTTSALAPSASRSQLVEAIGSLVADTETTETLKGRYKLRNAQSVSRQEAPRMAQAQHTAKLLKKILSPEERQKLKTAYIHLRTGKFSGKRNKERLARIRGGIKEILEKAQTNSMWELGLPTLNTVTTSVSVATKGLGLDFDNLGETLGPVAKATHKVMKAIKSTWSLFSTG